MDLKIRYLGVFILTLTFCVYLTYKNPDRTKSLNTVVPQIPEFLKISPAPLIKEQDDIIILYWTKYFRSDPMDRFPDHQMKINIGEQNCTIISDRSYFNKSDALIFHFGVSGDTSLDDMPLTHPSNQIWIFLQQESPALTLANLQPYGNIFNWTMTYRRDSDVPHPYFVTREQPTDAKNWTERNILVGKDKLVAWIVSNCQTPSKRHQYVHDPRRFIQVDTYGKCGNLSCPTQKGPQCIETLGKQYKFYLAFENSLCWDYATEKFANALIYNTVLVVMGGADYEALGPPGSFINVESYESPEMLAKYLISLDKDDEKYLQYFKWRKTHKVIRSSGFTQLCKKLIDQRQNPTKKVYGNLYKWWFYLNDVSGIEQNEKFVNNSACYILKPWKNHK